jgi:ER lumen protein retaining receptor
VRTSLALSNPKDDCSRIKRLKIRTIYADSFFRRYAMEGFFDPIPVIAGLVQTILYTDFFYIYWTKIMQGKQFNLPV